MEHRWGQRFITRVPVRLISESGEPICGQTVNISISGAFVEITRSGPLWARVEVEVNPQGAPRQWPERIAAHLTRRTRDGVAIEWCELAPQAVRALLPFGHPAAPPSLRTNMPRDDRPIAGLRIGSGAR